MLCSWPQDGSSSNRCSETYHGPSAESEPETRATSDFFRSVDYVLNLLIHDNYYREQTLIIGAIDWHSYSQLILRPYGNLYK